jgi:hypothetical protein
MLTKNLYSCFAFIHTGVSFIIKTKEEEAPLLRKSTALPYESSDSSEEDEEDDEQHG